MARDDMDAVLNDCLETAAYYLRQRGDFAPFGVTKTTTGEIHHIQLYDEEVLATERIGKLLEVLMAMAARGEIVTAAIVADCQLQDRHLGTACDAIRVDLDDIQEPSVRCFLPYQRHEAEVVEGELKAVPGETRIFQGTSA